MVGPGAPCPPSECEFRHHRRKEVNQVPPLRRFVAKLRQAWRDVDGQGLVEYALILALIAIIAIVALLFMGQQVSNKLSVIGSTIQSVQ